MNARPVKLLPLALALAVAPMFAHGEDLFDAYQAALANDPTLAQQVAQSNSTSEGVPLARAELLPQLSAGLTFQQSNNNGNSDVITDASGQPQSNPDWGHARSRDLSVNLSQTVLDFSKYARLSAAHAQADSADAQYRAALQDLIVRVASAYFDVLTAKDQVINSEAYEKQLARQLDQAQALFDNGLSPITDVQDAKAQHDAATAQLISARNTLDDAREALSEITGQPTQSLKVLSENLPMSPPSPNALSTWVDQARNGNPNILAQQYNVDAADHTVTAARDARLPTVNAHVSYGKGASWYQDGPYRSQPSGTTIGLTLDVPIFSGGSIRANVKRSIYDRDAAKAGLTKAERQIVRDTRNHFRSVIAGISEVEASHQAVISSTSALDATQAGFQVGTRTIVDVLLAQQNLTNARQQYSQSRHQFILNKLLLEQDAGGLDVDDLKAINALLVDAGSAEAPSLPKPSNPDDATPPAGTPPASGS